MATPDTTGAAALKQEVTADIAAIGARTRKERDALFDAAAHGMTPEHGKRRSEDPARKWTPQIIRKHKQGFSPAQIAKMASSPGINLKISARAVSRIISEHAKPQKGASAVAQK